MAVIVVGGQSRNVGKTSVIAGLISAMPELRWTAMKISGHEHEFCPADAVLHNDAAEDPSMYVYVCVERDAASGTDTSRFLAAGAVRSLLVRTRQEMLTEAMPLIRKELDKAENAILESNSIMKFLRPDLYLLVLDSETEDFKDSARLFLNKADAVLLHPSVQGTQPRWEGISSRLIENKPQFVIAPPNFISEELVKFVRKALTKCAK